MRRRDFITLLGAAAVASSLAMPAGGQQQPIVAWELAAATPQRIKPEGPENRAEAWAACYRNTQMPPRATILPEYL